MGFLNTSLVRRISTFSMCAFLLLGTTSACTKGTSGEQEEPPPAEQPTLRIMSYNIHWATGTDGILSLPRIAEVIKGSKADVVVLNEVDRHYDPRSQYEDQLQYLADELKMQYLFQKTTWKAAIPASGNKPREFGHAILSKYPLEQLNARIYDAYSTHYHGLLEAKVTVNEKPFLFYITHLDTDPASLSSQATQLRQWMAERTGTKILCGDMNAVPENPAITHISEGMKDAFAGKQNAFTFKSNNPTIRIDYILGSGDLSFSNSKVINSLASDHFPIVTDIILK
ncbi:endonuclease/exonuclease/phosphatase family protein [Chitinophaga cymbidii]|uniref:Metal-dependent hydrolase n=1 Tax=Chitinophaga cymbidii TaxID=1096750 RepID=A0A512RLM9_9BACT|nr:endonuclease/exonuclease/phosphatase family protein [Chitinophaga cymbidii]GEP96614.1 metal-dependent hydrolase [Chitinophaga cymbidii]